MWATSQLSLASILLSPCVCEQTSHAIGTVPSEIRSRSVVNVPSVLHPDLGANADVVYARGSEYSGVRSGGPA